MPPQVLPKEGEQGRNADAIRRVHEETTTVVGELVLQATCRHEAPKPKAQNEGPERLIEQEARGIFVYDHALAVVPEVLARKVVVVREEAHGACMVAMA